MQYLWLVFVFPLICQAAITERLEDLPLPSGKSVLSKRISTVSFTGDLSVSSRTLSPMTGSPSKSDDEDDLCAVDFRTKAYDLLDKNEVEEAGKLFIKSYLLEREECVSDESYAYLKSYDPAILDHLRKPRAEITSEDITAAVALFVKAYTADKDKGIS